MNFRYSGHRFSWKIADWLYPPGCAACGKPGFRICPQCFSSIQILSGNLCLSCGDPIPETRKTCVGCASKTIRYSAIASWCAYEGTIRKSIHDLKFNGNLGLADFFLPYLINIFEKQRWKVDLIVPVPMTKIRIRARGYNQSALLSRPLAWYFRIPHSTNTLVRIRDTQPQVKLSAIDRYTNLEGAFSVNPAKLINGKRVLVVDDVITTGSTLNHCAEALRCAGAVEVFGLSLARTLKGDSGIPAEDDTEFGEKS